MTKILTPDETRVNELMGVNPHEFIEARESDFAESRNQEGQSEQSDKIARLMGIPKAEAADRKLQTEKEEAARAPLTDEELEICRQLNVEPMEFYVKKLEEAGIQPGK